MLATLDVSRVSNTIGVNALACTHKKSGDTLKGPGMFCGTNFNLQLNADYN